MTTEKQQTIIDHKITSKIRAKSADYPRTASPMVSSSKTRSSTLYVNGLFRIEEEERGLNTLNNRFAIYLNKIKTLGDININLRRQIDDIYQKYMGYSSEIEFNNLRRQLNDELGKSLSLQICLQHADYDKKYYKNKLKIFSTADQDQIIKQQFDASLYELNLLKEQYQKKEQNLQVIKDFQFYLFI
jgi:hypothetical protein